MPTAISSVLGGASSGPRTATYTLTSSNASLAIPSWAQGGKGIVYVTGCGGGASGRVVATTGQRGTGGGSGGYAMRNPLSIPSATSTLAVTIGAGAASVSASSATNGGDGGDTTLSIGGMTLVLAGGIGGGVNANSSYKGMAFIGSTTGLIRQQAEFVARVVTVSYPSRTGLDGTLVAGAVGGDGASASGAFGAGGASPFGGFGAGLVAGPSVNTNGDNATGYGAGGAGALWISGGNATSGAGSPGLLILEFVEGV